MQRTVHAVHWMLFLKVIVLIFFWSRSLITKLRGQFWLVLQWMSSATNAWPAASMRCCAATACAFHMQHLCSVQSQLAECKAPWVILALLECTTTVSKLGASQTLAFNRSVCRTGQRNTPLRSSVLGWVYKLQYLGCCLKLHQLHVVPRGWNLC